MRSITSLVDLMRPPTMLVPYAKQERNVGKVKYAMWGVVYLVEGRIIAYRAIVGH